MKRKTENKADIRNTGLEPKPEAKSAAGSFIVEVIFSVLLIAAVCTLRAVTLFAGKANLFTSAASGGSVWIYMGISLAVFAVLRMILRKPYFAGIFVAFIALLIVKFDWLISFFSLFIKENDYAILCGMLLVPVLAGGFFFLLWLLNEKKFPFRTAAKILSATVTGLVLFGMAIALISPNDTQAAAIPSVEATPAPTPLPTPTPTPEPTPEPMPTPEPEPEPFGLPNVYLFVLDEYSSFDILSKYYDYDAKVFDEFLKIKGFNTLRESYATDNQTEHSMCDTLNLDYISRRYSKSKCFKAIANAELYKVFSDLGYSQFQLSTSSKHFKGIVSLGSSAGRNAFSEIVTGGMRVTSPYAPGEVSPNTVVPDEIAELLAIEAAGSDTEADTEALNEWGFYPSEYIRHTRRYSKHSQVNDLLTIFDYFEDYTHYVATTPRVTYCYMSALHVPFVFNEYGGILPSSCGRDWRNEEVYLGQYKFINKHLMATVSAITANDPDSIIIIMSDHGIRYHADCSKKHKFYITDKDSLRIMNAVYIKGEKYDIEGLSAVNTLRYILSLYDGLDYPAIEDPVTSDSPDRLRGIIPKPR